MMNYLGTCCHCLSGPESVTTLRSCNVGGTEWPGPADGRPYDLGVRSAWSAISILIAAVKSGSRLITALPAHKNPVIGGVAGRTSLNSARSARASSDKTAKIPAGNSGASLSSGLLSFFFPSVCPARFCFLCFACIETIWLATAGGRNPQPVEIPELGSAGRDACRGPRRDEALRGAGGETIEGISGGIHRDTGRDVCPALVLPVGGRDNEPAG